MWPEAPESGTATPPAGREQDCVAGSHGPVAIALWTLTGATEAVSLGAYGVAASYLWSLALLLLDSGSTLAITLSRRRPSGIRQSHAEGHPLPPAVSA